MFNLDLIYAWIYFEQESSKVRCCLELSVLIKQKMNPFWAELDFVNATAVIKTQAQIDTCIYISQERKLKK